MIDSSRERAYSSEVAVWYEWPLFYYFMSHFFPPGPPALMNGCLLLSVFGVAYSYRTDRKRATIFLQQPLAWLWIAFAALMGLSIFQAPEALRPESWHKYVSDFGKGSVFAVVLAFHLDRTERFVRLFIAGTVAMLGMLLHWMVTTWLIVRLTSVFPVQRDYLYWLLFFLPFSLGTYLISKGWRILAAIAVIATVALAVTTGFRGALLSIVVMMVVMLVFFRVWNLLVLGIVLAVLSVLAMSIIFPGQGSYVLAKMQQVSSSNRVTGIWIPAWEMSVNEPWFGHGFGHQVFRASYLDAVQHQPEGWTPERHSVYGLAPASPHSVYLETLFSAGFPGLFTYLAILFFCLFYLAQTARDCLTEVKSETLRIVSFSLFVCGVGNFVIFPIFETPAWRTLPIWVGIVLALFIMVEAKDGVIENGVGAI
ncbi:MAG: O-antigen ligase family protein [Nitrosomonas ureae]